MFRPFLPLVLAACSAPEAVFLVAEPVQPQEEDAPTDSGAPPPEDTAVEEQDCSLEGGALPIAAEGALLGQSLGVTATRARCTQALHAGSGAAGSTLSLQLEQWDGAGAAQLTVLDLLGEPIVDWATMGEGDALELSLPQSGEFLVQLAPVEVDEPDTTYTLSLDCLQGCDLEYTRYPVVLMHGAGTTDSFLGLIDTWGGLDEHLPSYGYHVEIHAVSAMDSVADRGEQWHGLIDELHAAGVGRRFNLIGHSQGGLDARYVAGVLEGEGRIASVTTISTPHRGASTADLVCGLIELGPFDGMVLDAVAEVFYNIFGQEGDELSAQLRDLTTESAAAFNQDVPDAEGVHYSSWAGHSCALLEFSCQSDMGGEIVNPLLSATFAYLWLMEGDNDGMVSVESAQWGDYQGEIGTDHYGAVGVPDSYTADYDHQQFFLEELRRLAALGY